MEPPGPKDIAEDAVQAAAHALDIWLNFGPEPDACFDVVVAYARLLRLKKSLLTREARKLLRQLKPIITRGVVMTGWKDVDLGGWIDRAKVYVKTPSTDQAVMDGLALYLVQAADDLELFMWALETFECPQEWQEKLQEDLVDIHHFLIINADAFNAAKKWAVLNLEATAPLLHQRDPSLYSSAEAKKLILLN